MPKKAHPPNYLFMDQSSAEWIVERVGQVTASRMAEVVTKLKNGKYSKDREDYMLELLAETLTGRAEDHYVSRVMDEGKENEPLARTAYEMRTGVDVDRIGYIRHPSIPRSGASPDSLVGDDGVLEIKCPKTTTHLTYFKAGVVPEEYVPQCVWELACSGRKWLDFVSYDFRLHEDFNLLIVRMERDDEQIAAMEEEVRTFRAELNALAETFLKGRDASAMRPQAVPVGPGVEKAQALPDDDWIGTAKEA